MQVWLKVLSAETEEDIKDLEQLEVSEVAQAVEAYRKITATEKFKELERVREKARRDEANALSYAAEVATERERAKWQKVVADKDAALADKDAEIAHLRARLEANG
jgi:hypothetical protein